MTANVCGVKLLYSPVIQVNCVRTIWGRWELYIPSTPNQSGACRTCAGRF